MNAELVEQYRLLHERRPDYGSGASHVERIAAIIERRGVRSVLDFGCGKGALVERLRARFPEVVVDGYDPAIRGRERIPLERYQMGYEMVIANDVLEHLDAEGYGEDLLEMGRLEPRWLFFNISCRPAVNVLPNGVNCHTLVRRPEWWREVLLACFPGFIEHGSEWNERSKGWMLAMTRPLELEGRRVAIVGNAPQAMGNREDVDGFDCVVRFNNFVVGDGYEAVGTRTDVLAIPACNRAVITPRLKRFTEGVSYVLDLATAGCVQAKANHGKIRQLLPHATIV
ncbi:MAG: methyltransferase domain-containing protein, partial [Verrucomicrobiaceae bacterium]